jgi:hypothetical protein
VPQPALDATSRSMQGGRAIAVAGGQSFGVAYMLDGATHNNPYDNLNLPLPFPDACRSSGSRRAPRPPTTACIRARR